MIVVCDSRIEYLEALEKAQQELNIDYSVEWTILHEKEIIMYGFPVYLIVEDDLDWCIDFKSSEGCSKCASKTICDSMKKVSYSYFMTKGRLQKLQRILKNV